MSQVNISAREFIDQYQSLIGSDSDSECSYRIINNARNLLYPLGDWVGTMGYLAMNVSGCFTLPSEYEFIRGARQCSGRVMDIELGHITKDLYCGCADSEILTKAVGRVYSPFQSTEGYPLAFFGINSKDTGAELRVIYKGTHGTIYDDTVNLLHQSPTVTRNPVGEVRRISKPRTHGLVRIAYGPDLSNPIGVDHILPGDTAPVYTRYEISCCGTIFIEAKKRLIPLTIEDSDQVLDLHPEAIASAITAIRARDQRNKGWQNDYNSGVRFAKDFLDQELSNEDSINKAKLAVNFIDGGFDELMAVNSHR